MGSLFSGSGGFELAASLCGIERCLLGGADGEERGRAADGIDTVKIFERNGGL